jgi:hypothetical protein
MALSFDTYTGDNSTTNFSVSFGYISQTHVDVYLDGVLQTVTTHYTWFNATTIQFLTAPATDVVIRIERNTPNTARLVDFQDAGNLTEADLDTNADQLFYIAQEVTDGFDAEAMKLAADDKWDAESKVMKNLADPVNDQDAATKLWSITAGNTALAACLVAQTAAELAETNAETAETNAAASEAAAASSESNAASSAGTASAQAASATASASAASTSETNAAASETAAILSETVAEEWAIKTTGLVVATDYSSKAYAIGNLTQMPYGSAERWATEVEDTEVKTGEYSALHHAAKAAASASAASASETAAGASETAAAASETAAAASAASIDASTMRNRKNMIINGCFRVWQRGTTNASVANGDFTADRWDAVYNTTAVFDIDKAVVGGSIYPFNSYLELDVTTADAAIGVSDYCGLVYRVEGSDCERIQWGQADADDITLSFWHAHTKTGTHGGSIRNAANTRSYTFEYTQSVADTFEQTTITIPADTTSTWLSTEAVVGLSVHFAAALGSSYKQAAGSWYSGNYLGGATQVNNLDSISNFMRFGQIQLEPGDTATEFEHRPIQQELALCQRYFVNVGGNVLGCGAMQSSTEAQVFVPLPVQLMVSPTLLSTTGSDYRIRTGSANLTASAVAVGSVQPNGVNVNFTVTGATQYNYCVARKATGSDLLFEAEL